MGDNVFFLYWWFVILVSLELRYDKYNAGYILWYLYVIVPITMLIGCATKGYWREAKIYHGQPRDWRLWQIVWILFVIFTAVLTIIKYPPPPPPPFQYIDGI